MLGVQRSSGVHRLTEHVKTFGHDTGCNAFDNDAENERCPSFPPKRSIEHLRLALPRTDAYYLRCFFDAFRFMTPEKKSWTLEIDAYDDDESLLEVIFPQVDSTSL